jgi:hypothetical protein
MHAISFLCFLKYTKDPAYHQDPDMECLAAGTHEKADDTIWKGLESEAIAPEV